MWVRPRPYWQFGTAQSLRLSKINNIRMKFQNLILMGCWKFLDKFHSCPHSQTFSLHKVKAPFRCPWEIINVLFSCNPFTFFFKKNPYFREREGETPKCMRDHTSPTGDLACNPGMCPDWELNQQPFGHRRAALNPLGHTSQGLFIFFLYHLGWNRDPRDLLQNPGLHLLLHLWPLWKFPLHCLLLSWHLKKLFFLLSPQSDDTLCGRRSSVSWQLCCHAF